MAIGEVAVRVLPDSTDFWRSFRARTSGQAEAEGRRAGEDFRRGMEGANARPLQIKAELDAARLRAQIADATRSQSVRVRADVDTSRARAEIKSLQDQGKKSGFELKKALYPIAPALVPVAAAAAAAGAGLAGLGAAGLLAFGGLKNAIDTGSVAGQGLQSTLGGLKSDLAGLQSQAAAGVLPGVEASIATIKREASTLGPIFKGEAALLGTALSSITTGLVGGFNSFAPVLNQVGVSIDHVAAVFAAWATGPGGAKFANALSADYAQVAPVIGEVAQALGRVIGAGNATGLSIVSLIGDVASVINAFPMGALTAIVDGFVLFKAAMLASTAYSAAKAGIATLGVAYNNVAAISQASSVRRIAADEAAASVAADAAARSAAAMVLEAEAARASLLEIAAARGSNTASQQAQLDVQLATADRQIAAYQAVATAAAASAAEQGAIAEGMAAANTRIGGAAKTGLFGIVGGVAAAALGIGLLVSQFHNSEDASKAAAAAAQAYTDALKGGNGADLADTITKGLTDANIGAKVREVNAALSDLGKGDFSASRQFGRSLKGITVDAADFAGAIKDGGPALAALRGQLTTIATVSDATASKFEKLAIANRGDQRTLQLKEQAYSKQASAARTLLRVLNDQVKAYHAGQKAEIDYYATIGHHVATIEQVSGALHLSANAVKTYGEMAGIAFSKNGVADASLGRVRAAVAAVSLAFNTASASGSAFLSALHTFSTSAGTSADRAALIGSTLVAANGDALGFASAMNGAAVATHTFFTDVKSNAKSANQSIGGYLSSLINLRTGTINYSKAGAGPLIQDLQNIQSAAMTAAQATYQHARATEGGKRAADDAYKVYKSQTRGALMDEATQLGLTSGQAKKLADKYFGMPKKVKTLIEQEGANPVVTVLNQIGTQLSFLTHHPWNPKVGVNDKATPKLHDIFNDIDALHDKTVTITVGLNNNAGQLVHDAVNNIPGSAAGSASWTPNGKLPPGLSTVGERGWELVSTDARGRSQVFSHAQSVAMTGLPRTLPGFAAGTAANNAAQISAALRSAFHFTRSQIAGFLGNFQVESRMNPNAYNPRENAHGIAQWEGSRWTALQSYAKHMGVQANSMAAQTGFLVKELRGSGIVSQVKKMSDPAKVAAYVDAHYERSAGTTRGAREAAARQFARNGTAAAGGAAGGAQNARAAAATKAEKAASAASVKGALGAVGQSASRPFDINQVGYARIRQQLAHVRVLLNNADLTPAARASLTRQYNNAMALALRERHELRVKIRGTDLAAISKAVGGTAADMRASFQQVITDMRNAGASAGQIARVRRRETAAVAANSRYTAARDYSSGIKSTLAGTFDPTHFGSAQDLISGLRGQTDQNNAYAKELNGLRGKAKGNKTLTAFINHLAESGQTATLESLAGASKGDLANVTKGLGAYNASLQTGADAATTSKYGKTADQLHDAVEKQVMTTDKLIAAVTHLAGAVGNSHKQSHHQTKQQLEQAMSQLNTLSRHGRRPHP